LGGLKKLGTGFATISRGPDDGPDSFAAIPSLAAFKDQTASRDTTSPQKTPLPLQRGKSRWTLIEKRG
jgi:hypothetical protein